MKDLKRIEELKHVKQMLMIQEDFYNYEYDKVREENGGKITAETEFLRKKLRAALIALENIEFLIKAEEY